MTPQEATAHGEPDGFPHALDWITPPVAPGSGPGPDLLGRRVKCGMSLPPQGADEP
ncbi:MAG: hypothetical protein DVB23_002174 [Verrucomicrobia bacterium]|jgi:hypothetical protein|nr:MAG: hypothetical protein DVB23_002174 [Verrucomicrobiota bacterium]